MPPVVMVPHHDLCYDDTNRKTAVEYTIEEIKQFDKAQAVKYARCAGFPETGMSQNEVGLIYDLLEKKQPKYILELGRNFGVSTRIFLQHAVRHPGVFLESWDLKHWGNVKETFAIQGFHAQSMMTGPGDYGLSLVFGGPVVANMRIANSMKTNIGEVDGFIDFLLIDTEHGLENAIGEYMRFRQYMRSGCIIAFHDADLPAVHRAIEMAIEVESDFGGRIQKHYINERHDGFGIEMLEWKG